MIAVPSGGWKPTITIARERDPEYREYKSRFLDSSYKVARLRNDIRALVAEQADMYLSNRDIRNTVKATERGESVRELIKDIGGIAVQLLAEHGTAYAVNVKIMTEMRTVNNKLAEMYGTE